MTAREVVPGWIIDTYDGTASPIAYRHDWCIGMDVNDDDTITIEHDVTTGWDGSSTTERVTIPIRWVTEMIAATLVYRATKAMTPVEREPVPPRTGVTEKVRNG